jgi:hypothetical protein
MGKKKALLIVSGGRGTPDVLTLLCVRPQLIVILTSEEGWGDETTFREIAQTLTGVEEILPTIQVSSYKLDLIKATCLEACRPYLTDYEWAFSIGSCPKIMGIGAYEAAKEMDVPCIYMDTGHEKIVSLVKDIEVPSDDFFHMELEAYLQIFGRKPEKQSADVIQYRTVVGQWGHIARIMALSSATPTFSRYMLNKKIGDEVTFPVESPELSLLLNQLENVGVIKTTRQGTTRRCQFTSPTAAQFLGTGDWLEVFVWNEAKQEKFAYDSQWGYKLQSQVSPTDQNQSKGNNEFDGLFMYQAQLLIVECKAEADPFKGEKHHLDFLNSKSEMLGRTYTTKIFVTNASKSLASYTDFEKRARLRKIVVVTAENLADVGKILKKEAERPTYSRT